MNKPQWMSDPDIADIPQNKLDFLQLMVSQGNGLSPKEMLPFLMRVAKQGKENAISFSPEELKRIVKRSAEILAVPIDEEGALEIARRSRGTPRITIVPSGLNKMT